MAVVLPLEKRFRQESPCALDSLVSLLETDKAAVDRILAHVMKNDVPLIETLGAHIISAGGKRLRPLLALACANLCGYKGERHHALAACVELMHTATLLHDDVVDASLRRRGKPSANAVFGNQTSVLVGDYLLSRAFQLMVEDSATPVLRILSDAAAVIAQGEIMHLALQNDGAFAEQAYLDVVRAKTAELFAASCRIGAVIAKKPKNAEESLRTFGLNFGMAFQIVDDVLDYAAAPEALGKNAGDDFKEGKPTLPVILAITRCEQREKETLQAVFSDPNARNAAAFEKTRALLLHCGACQDSLARAQHYCSIAKDSLGAFETSPIKTALLAVLTQTIDRGEAALIS